MEEITEWMSTGEAGALIGVTGSRVADWIESGHIVGVRTHLGWLCKPSSVSDFAKRRTAMPRRLKGHVTPPLPERVSA